MDRFGGLIRSLARRLCPDPVEAEDAVEEIFIDLPKSVARSRPVRFTRVDRSTRLRRPSPRPAVC